ncbi:phage tail sheath family protein [Pseudomonas sp. NPDC086251]|uniref:phage tail sheath family protein n=1 Tax=Pseudomonas sp. NPDC086251 TaxID=3364431 RepID=UPI003838EAD8
MPTPQPGVVVSETTLSITRAETRSAVPLFIGYTEKGPTSTLQAVNDFSEYQNIFGGASRVVNEPFSEGVLYYCMKHYFDNEGSGGFVLSLGRYANRTGAQIVTALGDPLIANAIAGQPLITLIAFPDTVLLPDDSPSLWHEAWQLLLNLCQCRSGLFALLETPDLGANVNNCLNTFVGTHRGWGAAYWPRLVSEYRDNDRPVVIPPSAAVAAAIERVDKAAGVWTAPANVVLSKVIDTTQPPLALHDQSVNSNAGVNLIRSFPGRGVRIWGCRTLSPELNSPACYVQVRRLLSYIETNASRLARMFVFERNNEITWYKVKGQVSNWLNLLWVEGGLFGAQEEQAFSVHLGLDETMTEDDVRAGIMILNVRVAPLYPAEFIELSLQFDLSGDRSL